jgi:hypothetical protein
VMYERWGSAVGVICIFLSSSSRGRNSNVMSHSPSRHISFSIYSDAASVRGSLRRASADDLHF